MRKKKLSKKAPAKKRARKRKSPELQPLPLQPVKRISNREYEARVCAKPSCPKLFIPTDGRQKYCCAQHRIDDNNDKRKYKSIYDMELSVALKHNYKVLQKVLKSTFYIEKNTVSKALLEYENYQFNSCHRKKKNKITGREILFCYDLGIECVNTEHQLYTIHHLKT